MASVMKRTSEDAEARSLHIKDVRRKRIMRRDSKIHWHQHRIMSQGYKIHHHQHDGRFDEDIEDMILDASHELELPRGACAETKEENLMKRFEREAERKFAKMYENCVEFRPHQDREEKEKRISSEWKTQMASVPRGKRGALKARYVRCWLGRKRS
jgi:hypothetical protein